MPRSETFDMADGERHEGAGLVAERLAEGVLEGGQQHPDHGKTCHRADESRGEAEHNGNSCASHEAECGEEHAVDDGCGIAPFLILAGLF